MNQKRFGEPLRRTAVQEIVSVPSEQRSPGLGWEISTEAREEIEKIEENIRLAEQRSGSIVIG